MVVVVVVVLVLLLLLPNGAEPARENLPLAWP